MKCNWMVEWKIIKQTPLSPAPKLRRKTLPVTPGAPSTPGNPSLFWLFPSSWGNPSPTFVKIFSWISSAVCHFYMQSLKRWFCFAWFWILHEWNNAIYVLFEFAVFTLYLWVVVMSLHSAVVSASLPMHNLPLHKHRSIYLGHIGYKCGWTVGCF